MVVVMAVIMVVMMFHAPQIHGPGGATQNKVLHPSFARHPKNPIMRPRLSPAVEQDILVLIPLPVIPVRGDFQGWFVAGELDDAVGIAAQVG